MRELGKPFLKNQMKKQKKNRKSMSKCLWGEKTTLILTKKGLERTVNGLGKPFGKKSDQKNLKKKQKKKQSEIAACEQKKSPAAKRRDHFAPFPVSA